MASPWRRRPLCTLVGDSADPGALREISGIGAFLETSARPPLGTRVELRHPEAGAISAAVSATSADGVRLSFDPGIAAMAFALTAIACDMSLPN
ncbi:hypothetical protein ABC347_07135 [Sphingomonas sp. 1P06PA]|uniref:hypothetical protein n=1 Tax=Sphingomonas sp. 1P06PA TaxID=554121 RepID=UPI0039A6DBD5